MNQQIKLKTLLIDCTTLSVYAYLWVSNYKGSCKSRKAHSLRERKKKNKKKEKQKRRHNLWSEPKNLYNMIAAAIMIGVEIVIVIVNLTTSTEMEQVYINMA